MMFELCIMHLTNFSDSIPENRDLKRQADIMGCIRGEQDTTDHYLELGDALLSSQSVAAR